MKFFVDTNIFVNWALIKEALQINKEQLDDIIPFHKKIKPSVDFLDHIQLGDNNNTFLSTHLCITELPASLIRHVVRNKMFLNNISFNYYEKYKIRFLGKLSDEVYQLIDTVFQTFISSKLIKLVFFDKFSDKDFRELDQLQVECGLDSSDALIFLIAFKEGSDFLVSNDRDFLDNKKLKRRYRNIKIISAQAALHRIYGKL